MTTLPVDYIIRIRSSHAQGFLDAQVDGSLPEDEAKKLALEVVAETLRIEWCRRPEADQK